MVICSPHLSHCQHSWSEKQKGQKYEHNIKMDLRQKVCDGAANSSGTRKMMFYLVSYFTT